MKIVGASAITSKDLVDFNVPPAWRKATRNMILSTLSQERAMHGLNLETHTIEQMGLVLGSNSGELDTSADFLLTFFKTKMARPLLFQNSLHNATTGFSAIHWQIKGPSISVSCGQKTSMESLLTAKALIDSGQCELCIMTLVEVHQRLAQMIDVEVNEGAVSLVIGSEQAVTRLSLPVVDDLSSRWLGEVPVVDLGPLFDVTKSAVFKLAQEFGG